ncbi:hypothetical protein OUHCRE8_08270 [Enterobacter asburiae]
MAKNEFKPFSIAGGANVISQADYEVLAALSTGFTSGVAKANEINKVLRQASFVAAALAQFISDKTNSDVLDDGSLSGFETKLIAALNALSQPLDATLTALAGLQTGPNKVPYFTDADIAALTDLTVVGRNIIGKGSVSEVVQYLGLQNALVKGSYGLGSRDSQSAASKEHVGSFSTSPFSLAPFIQIVLLPSNPQAPQLRSGGSLRFPMVLLFEFLLLTNHIQVSLKRRSFTMTKGNQRPVM